MAKDEVFRLKAPWIIVGLRKEFGLTLEQAAAVLGNIGHECAGFTLMQEVNPVNGGEGGYGWCQWTGDRRTKFQAFAVARSLSMDDDAANYGYLISELRNSEKGAINALRSTETLEDGVREFERHFERADPRYKAYSKREAWAKKALEAFSFHPFSLVDVILGTPEKGEDEAEVDDDGAIDGGAEDRRGPLPTADGSPTSSFAKALVDRALAELASYNTLLERQSPLRERIGEYWTFLGRPDLDGSDHDVPWSAAFISYMVHLAGAGTAFPYSAQHSTYLYRTINDRLLKKKVSFLGYRPNEIEIRPGDILGMNRSGAAEIDYDWAAHHNDYKSHSDIVVAVDGAEIHAVGGNVGKRPGQIGRKRFGLKNGKLVNLAPRAQQTVFVVTRSYLS